MILPGTTNKVVSLRTASHRLWWRKDNCFVNGLKTAG